MPTGADLISVSRLRDRGRRSCPGRYRGSRAGCAADRGPARSGTCVLPRSAPASPVAPGLLSLARQLLAFEHGTDGRRSPRPPTTRADRSRVRPPARTSSAGPPGDRGPSSSRGRPGRARGRCTRWWRPGHAGCRQAAGCSAAGRSARPAAPPGRRSSRWGGRIPSGLARHTVVLPGPRGSESELRQAVASERNPGRLSIGQASNR